MIINEVLDSFAGQLSKFKQEVNQSLSALDEKTRRLAEDKEALAKEKEALGVRESEIKKIENIVSLAEESKKMMKEAQNKMSGLSQEKDAFDNFRKERMSEINRKEADLIEKGKYIKTEYNSMQKERKLLDEDKATYKEKIASSLVNLADKK